MDIQKIKMVLHKNIKRFTLKATASAMFTLHAENAAAVSCPASITADTGLAGVICDFDVITGSSITVENGGTVGGINMTTYTPTSPSFISIDAGGNMSDTTNPNIAINGSLLSNGISNQGTINNVSSSSIAINTSTISGGISNSGLISTGSIGIGK